MTHGVGGNLSMTDMTTSLRVGFVGEGEMITPRLLQMRITGRLVTKNQLISNLGITGRNTTNRTSQTRTIPNLHGTRVHWLHMSQEVGHMSPGEPRKRGITLTRSAPSSSMRTSRLKGEAQVGIGIKDENVENIIFKATQAGILAGKGKSGMRPPDGTNRQRTKSEIQMTARTAHGNQDLLGSSQTGIILPRTRMAIGITTSSPKVSKRVPSRNINGTGEMTTTI